MSTGVKLAYEIKRERSKVLSQLSEFLCPSKDYERIGNELGTTIISICQAIPGYKISRPTVGGSIGKKTALPDQFFPDFDIILVFNETFGLAIDVVNGIYPKTPEVKKKFASVQKDLEKAIKDKLEKEAQCKIVLSNHTHKCLKIQVEKNKRTYSFDILPAHNFHPVVKSGEVPMQEHLRKATNTINYIYNHDQALFKTINGYYSSCFSEGALNFVKKQSSLINQNIRLAKFWLHHIMKEKKDVYGLTFLVELVAIQVGQSEEKKNAKDNFGYDAFVKFLNCMKNFNDMAIYFEDAYTKKEIPAAILKKPFVLDPANPTNNVASNITIEVQELLKEKAVETLDHLTKNFDEFIEKIPTFFLKLFFRSEVNTPLY